MKTYPYHTPEGIIELVEKRELDQLLERLANAEELLREIMRDEVNAQDEAEKWLRSYAPHLLFSDNDQGDSQSPTKNI